MNANLLSRMQMEHAMRQALGLDRMAVHYQPQVNMATGRITGAEALIRWTDPEFGAVSPGQFIPLAEESGYIVTLGAWVMGSHSGTWLLAVGGLLMLAGVGLHLLESHDHEHIHALLEHEHAHSHDDGHHLHHHEPMPTGPHSHWHRHQPLQHAHPHVPDAHHLHTHV